MFSSSNKDINRLIGKGMPNFSLKRRSGVLKTSNFIVFRSVFVGQIKLTQISFTFKTSCFSLKIRVSRQKGIWLFHYFNFQRNYGVLNLTSLCFLLNKNITFNKNETESKMENLAYTFREMNLVLSTHIKIAN